MRRAQHHGRHAVADVHDGRASEVGEDDTILPHQEAIDVEERAGRDEPSQEPVDHHDEVRFRRPLEEGHVAPSCLQQAQRGGRVGGATQAVVEEDVANLVSPRGIPAEPTLLQSCGRAQGQEEGGGGTSLCLASFVSAG
eukprot:scaffold1282_cov251-Pinguiococcus_pyrenoidosus.AAC.35